MNKDLFLAKMATFIDLDMNLVGNFSSISSDERNGQNITFLIDSAQTIDYNEHICETRSHFLAKINDPGPSDILVLAS